MISIKAKKITALALTLLMSLTVLTACGDQKTPASSADQQKTESQVLTKDEYVEKVKNLSMEVSEITNKYSADIQSSDVNAAADATSQLIGEIKPIYEEMGALNAPEEFASQQSTIKAGCDASVEILNLSLELIDLGRGKIEGNEEEIANKVTELNSKITDLTSQAQEMTAAITEVITA